MKKIILPIIILSLFFSTGVLAQETDLPDPGLTPDSSFYFLDTLGEKIGMFFTFGAEKKAEKAMGYAEEKLAEVKAMAEKNKAKAIEKANQGYQKYLGLANEKVKEAGIQGKDVEELITLIIIETLRHQEVLTEVLKKVPEQAKSGVEKAIEVSRKGFEEAIKAAGPEQLIRESILRMDEGDFQFRFDRAVNEYGKKFTPDEMFASEQFEEIKAMYKEVLGEKGENITVKSIDFLGRSRATDLSLLPSETLITEFYDIEVNIKGEVKDKIWENKFLGKKLSQVVKADGEYYFYIGKHLSLSFHVIYERALAKIPAECEEMIDRDECFHFLAREQKNISLCEEILDLCKRENCYNSLAIITDTFSLCQKITTCRDSLINCYTSFAKKYRDVSICDNLEDKNRAWCYEEVRQEQIDETANWKVYSNEGYGFEARYPPGWKAGVGALPNNFVFGESGWPNAAKVNITVYTESFLDKIYKEEAREKICTRVVLSGEEAYRCEGADFIHLEAEHNGKFYLWSVFGTRESEKFKIFDQILSTFKFIAL